MPAYLPTLSTRSETQEIRHRGLPPGVDLASMSGADTGLIERLRKAARRARCGRNLSLSDAHRMLACPGAASGATEALVRTLAEALGRRPVFHAPGERLASFDEAWLMRCHAAQAAQDVDSLSLLVRSRVAAPQRRFFLDLLRAI